MRAIKQIVWLCVTANLEHPEFVGELRHHYNWLPGRMCSVWREICDRQSRESRGKSSIRYGIIRKNPANGV